MKLIHFDRFIINTTNSIQEVREKLEHIVEDKRILNSLRSNKKFEGVISDFGFKFSRIIAGRNSFLPILHGEFSETEQGTEIRIKMRLHRFVRVFLLIWSLGFGLPSIISLLSGDFKPFNFGMVLFVIFFAGSVPIFFHIEGNKAKEILKEVFR